MTDKRMTIMNSVVVSTPTLSSRLELCSALMVSAWSCRMELWTSRARTHASSLVNWSALEMPNGRATTRGLQGLDRDR